MLCASMSPPNAVVARRTELRAKGLLKRHVSIPRVARHGAPDQLASYLWVPPGPTRVPLPPYNPAPPSVGEMGMLTVMADFTWL